MTTLNIAEIINSKSAILSDTGEIVFQKIKEYVEKDEPVTLDFTGIETLTTAFLNLAIGQLYDLRPTDQLTKLVKIKKSSVSNSHLQKIGLVLTNSKEKRQELADLQDEVMQDGYWKRFKDLNIYTFNQGESFIVDTNVWIYLFSPFSTNDFGYQNFLSEAQNKKCKLFINSQIISEYINVICRTAYENYVRANGFTKNRFKFKRDYQQTTDFYHYYQLACESVKNDILKYSKISPIKLWHIRNSLNDYHQMKDYNDLLYTKMTKEKIKIVSHDKDFGNHPEDIIWLHY